MMRATTLKASSAGLSALVDYYAGLAADSSIGTALAVDRSTTTSTRPSRPAGGGARVVVPWGWPGMCSLVLMAALTGLSRGELFGRWVWSELMTPGSRSRCGPCGPWPDRHRFQG